MVKPYQHIHTHTTFMIAILNMITSLKAEYMDLVFKLSFINLVDLSEKQTGWVLLGLFRHWGSRHDSSMTKTLISFHKQPDSCPLYNSRGMFQAPKSGWIGVYHCSRWGTKDFNEKGQSRTTLNDDSCIVVLKLDCRE